MSGNPFSALQDSSDSDEEEAAPAAAAAPKSSYTITRGTQATPGGVPEAHGVGSLRGRTATFYGRCYICDYPAHSQKHCPLRQCRRCHEWGHADRACHRALGGATGPWVLPAADRQPFLPE